MNNVQVKVQVKIFRSRVQVKHFQFDSPGQNLQVKISGQNLRVKSPGQNVEVKMLRPERFMSKVQVKLFRLKFSGQKCLFKKSISKTLRSKCSGQNFISMFRRKVPKKMFRPKDQVKQNLKVKSLCQKCPGRNVQVKNFFNI